MADVALRIGTFNIRHGAPPGGRTDMAATAAALATMRADVLGLCEVDRRSLRSGFQDQPAGLARALGMRWAFAASRRWFPDRYGVALLVRQPEPIRRIERIGLPSVGERRVVLLAEVAPQGSPMSVAVTHLETDGQRARNPVDQLAVVLDALTRRPPPWVLLGDLNLEVPAIRDRLFAAGLVVADASPTYPAWSPSRRIDVVAVGGGLVPGPGEVPNVSVSDHLPVVAPVHPVP